MSGAGGIPLASMASLVGGLWSPLLPTNGGHYPEHWYRSDQGLWQDAGVTPATADGDVVGRWEDLTANADHVNQAVALDKPTLQNGAGDLLNGHPVVRFDGVNDYIMGAFTTGGALAQPFTTFIVAALDAAAVDDGTSRVVVYSDDLANIMQHKQEPSAGVDYWRVDCGNALNGGATNSNWNIWTSLFNGVGSAFWHNGILQAAGNVGANAPDGITIGARFNGSWLWDGDVTEVLIYHADLSTADDNQVGNYLATRYGLAYTDI